jgi:hypothetical protein
MTTAMARVWPSGRSSLSNDPGTSIVRAISMCGGRPGPRHVVIVS